MFFSVLQSSEGAYMDDWLNSLFEDPVLNDKMITEAVPSPRIQSEHSYSINNDLPQSPLALMDSNVEGGCALSSHTCPRYIVPAYPLLL